MREESQHEDAIAAAADGYTGSAKVVGSAAIIMISVFVIPMTVIPRQHIPEKPDDRRAR